MTITTILARYLGIVSLFIFLENWSNAENFNMRFWENKYGDISFLFHKCIAHAWNKLYAKYWKYFNMGSI